MLRGNFNGWQGNKDFLTDADNDGIYSLNYELGSFEGDILEYKFVICKSGGNELWEQNPAPDNPPYRNRKILLSEVSHPLPVVSFDLDLCANNGGDPFCAAYLLSYIVPEPVPYFAEPYGKYAGLAQPVPLAKKTV